MPTKAGGLRAGRPLSDLDVYQPVDFSSLPVGPDFHLVDGKPCCHRRPSKYTG